MCVKLLTYESPDIYAMEIAASSFVLEGSSLENPTYKDGEW